MTELYLHWEDPASLAARSRIVTDGLRIGSADGPADIRIDAPGLNPVHAEIRLRPDGTCTVVGMGSSRIVTANGAVPSCTVFAGSAVELGSLTLRFASTASLGRTAAAAPPPARPAAPRKPPAVTRGPRRSGAAVVAAASIGAALLAASAVYVVMRRPEAPRQAPAAAAPASLPLPVPATAAAPAPAAAATASGPAAGPEDHFDQARKSVVTVIAKHSFEKGFATGTGFFVDAQGRVVTNFHVVRQTDYQQILLPGSKEPIDARILSKDQEGDLVLLQTYVTPPVSVAPMTLSSSDLKMGDTVFALGSPAGPELAVSLSRGIVSSDRPRTFGDRSFIQHDAAVNPGNSGGPLLNVRGQVVGLNVAKIRDTEGISFAIPIEDVRRFIEVAR